jgi:hypothetical protein
MKRVAVWYLAVAYLVSAAWLGFWGWFGLMPYCFTGCPGSFVPVIFGLGTICILFGLPVILKNVFLGTKPSIWARTAVATISIYGVAESIEWAYAAIVIKGCKADYFFDFVPSTSAIPFMIISIIYLGRLRSSKSAPN